MHDYYVGSLEKKNAGNKIIIIAVRRRINRCFWLYKPGIQPLKIKTGVLKDALIFAQTKCRMFHRINAFSKDFLLYTRLFYIFYPFRKFFLFLHNFASLTVWANANKNKTARNDFFRARRNYSDRFKGYEWIAENYSLKQKEAILYMEFGVASGTSFDWWQKNALNEGSLFYGFDTFEGLPEDWGLFYKKGDMSHDPSHLLGQRSAFFKGLFQDSLLPFINDHTALLKSDKRKVIHLDADLFSATLFVLSQLYPYLKKGDILIFDEFNVASHEFFAFDIFQKSFYIKLKPLSAINNYYQMMFMVE